MLLYKAEKEKRNFYPRSPRGERPSHRPCLPQRDSFLSTLPARGATTLQRVLRHVCAISIHAPREGSDALNPSVGCIVVNISIHAPREGSDTQTARSTAGSTTFLSTLPARGATSAFSVISSPASNFYPRSPRGERPVEVERDKMERLISIHAPREGSDLRRCCAKSLIWHFYPRSPRGERRARPPLKSPLTRRFLSTLPARGATISNAVDRAHQNISIHAPREGSDKAATAE